MANPEVEALRSAAIIKQRRAAKKISRTRRVNGAEIAGTEFDPRKPVAQISRMNTRQLKALNENLDHFNHRRTQFYSGLNGTVHTARQKRQFESAVKAANERNMQVFNEFENLTIGPAGYTVGERMTMRRTMKSANKSPLQAVNDPFKELNLKMANINASNESMQKLMDKLKKQASPEFLESEIRRERESFGKMMDVIQRDDLRQAVDSLTDKQFAYMWFFTPFTNTFGATYDSISKGLDKKDEAYANLLEGDIKEAMDYVQDAKSKNL